jgi:hypothetical protein
MRTAPIGELVGEVREIVHEHGSANPVIEQEDE